MVSDNKFSSADWQWSDLGWPLNSCDFNVSHWPGIDAWAAGGVRVPHFSSFWQGNWQEGQKDIVHDVLDLYRPCDDHFLVSTDSSLVKFAHLISNLHLVKLVDGLEGLWVDCSVQNSFSFKQDLGPYFVCFQDLNVLCVHVESAELQIIS